MPGKGLEPSWVTPLAPKASASTNFATRALCYSIVAPLRPAKFVGRTTWGYAGRGARGGNRTRTAFRPTDFKSGVATNYTTRAYTLSSMRRGRELNPRMSVLQTEALPLRHHATCGIPRCYYNLFLILAQ